MWWTWTGGYYDIVSTYFYVIPLLLSILIFFGWQVGILEVCFSFKILQSWKVSHDQTPLSSAGVGYSFPKINCFASSAEELTFWARSIPWVGIEARGNFSFGPDIDGFYGNVDDTDTKLRQLGERCALLSGANLTYVGTVSRFCGCDTIYTEFYFPEISRRPLFVIWSVWQTSWARISR